MPRRRLLHRARTAVGLPGRVVACEDRTSALETEVGERIEEIRYELGTIRALLTAQLESDADTTELLGRLLRSTSERLDLLEESVAHPGALPLGVEQSG